eukprot:COSAG01_NODE_47777_length_387_cov_0.715278_1_plen_113_part_01
MFSCAVPHDTEPSHTRLSVVRSESQHGSSLAQAHGKHTHTHARSTLRHTGAAAAAAATRSPAIQCTKHHRQRQTADKCQTDLDIGILSKIASEAYRCDARREEHSDRGPRPRP